MWAQRPLRTSSLLAVALLTLSCSPPNATTDLPGNAYPPRASLEAEPAYRLQVPDAEKLSNIGSERFNNITGPQPAFVGGIWGTSGSMANVFTYYNSRLRELGWIEDKDPILIDVELVAKAWCKAKLLFRVGIFDPKDYGRVGVKGAERFVTVFQARLQGVTGSCPR